jgi:hypothetical protein
LDKDGTDGANLLYQAKNILQVNRAFSFDRTPTSVRLKRAVSSMISPLSNNSNANIANSRLQLSLPKF